MKQISKVKFSEFSELLYMSKKGTIGPYIVTGVLGEGTTGKVKLVTHKDTGQEFAIKIISKSSFEQNKSLQSKVQREIALMRIVSHPNILRLIDVLESQRHLYIILEYAKNGELFDFLVENKSLPEDLAIDFFRQMVLAIEYLHFHGICHRDLKPENILLDANNRIKIADFGFARWLKKDMTDTSCGSPHYAAPEVIKGVLYDGRKADIWSLGVILYALLAGYLPFDDPSIRNLLHKVKRGIFQMPPFPPDIKDLISRMLKVDPNCRASIIEIKSHPAFRSSLSMTYILPSPIPLISDSHSIDPSQISPEIIRLLEQIGFNNEEELFQELQSTTNTMAKVFVSMLTPKIDLEQLPWDASCGATVHPGLSPLNSSSFMVSTKNKVFNFDLDGNITLNSDNTKKDQFEKPNSLSTVEMSYSIAHRPSWVVDGTDSDLSSQNIVTLTFDNVPIWDLMCRAEESAGDLGFQWFHPDPVTMYFRSHNADFYATLNATFKNNQESGSEDNYEISLHIQLNKGQHEQLKEFSDKLHQNIIGVL